MNIVDAREDLINEICQYLMPLVPDLADAKSAMYMILNDYEITNRCTEVAELSEDRNEYLLKKFIIAKTVSGCTERTIKYYRVEIAKILRKIGKTVDDITPDDIRYYMAVRKRRDKVSSVTIGNEIRALGSFFTWITNEGILMGNKNPMLRVDRIKQKKTKKEALTDMEVERLRMAAVSLKEKAIIEVLLSTGVRVAELAQIQMSEIEENRILIHGKGQKDRYVYLNARAMLTVENYLAERRDKNPYLFPKMLDLKDMRVKMKENGITDVKNLWKDPKFVADGHIDAGSVEGITRNLAKRAGVSQANPHKFRRTCATMALRRGMPIEQVSRMLGHEQLTTTQIYLDLTEDEMKQAHKKYGV